MPLFKFVVLIITLKANYFEVIPLSSQSDEIMSLAVAEVIRPPPPQQVGVMFSANSWSSLPIEKSKCYNCHKDGQVKLGIGGYLVKVVYCCL